MLGQQSLGRKRGREGDGEDADLSSFSEHRNKRRVASLPHRLSPSERAHPFGPNSIITSAPATITPADSENEETPINQRSAFSPWSSPAQILSQMSNSLSRINSSQLNTPLDVPIDPDDLEMTDSFHLSPLPEQIDHSINVTGRIPTPIHSSFTTLTRASRRHYPDAHFADDEGSPISRRRGRRLPSPISEGEPSPSVIIDSFGEMQMEVETPVIGKTDMRRDIPTKKGHSRSRHSVRTWTDSLNMEEGDGSNGTQPKKWSMGYRSDCDKCRDKVPGHFSHVVFV